jgi:hypothetical protein
MAIGKLIRAELDAGHRDTDLIAKTVLKAALDADDPFELLYSVVRSFVSTSRHSFVKGAERAWDDAERELSRADGRHDNRSAWVNAAVEARNRLLSESFFVPGKGSVLWAVATVEDHQKAIGHSRKIMAGHEADIARHERAIRKIRGGQGSCLADVQEAV